jgi:DNA-binding winged helix-turn-helix (wHTH) protein
MNIGASTLHQFHSQVESPWRNRTGHHLEVVSNTTDSQDSDSSPDKPATAISVETTETVILFGPFRLLPAQRLLLKDNTPIRLGSRALEILIVLVDHQGELVSKNDLMARVWPDTTVVEANLSVHIAALRRALGDGRDGNRYLLNMPGRGYRFVAPITHVEEPAPSTPIKSAAAPLLDLPKLPTQSVGHHDNISELMPVEKQIDASEHGVWLVDLGSITDVSEVVRAIAVAIGVEIRSEQRLADLLRSLIQKRILLAWHAQS